jgi:hypothetical protein
VSLRAAVEHAIASSPRQVAVEMVCHHMPFNFSLSASLLRSVAEKQGLGPAGPLEKDLKQYEECATALRARGLQ